MQHFQHYTEKRLHETNRGGLYAADEFGVEVQNDVVNGGQERTE
jgi:hypothetical protein